MSRLIIFDSNALIHRAFHALPPLTSQEGELVNALYGFLLVFFKTMREFKPAYVAATFDVPGATVRHETYQDYKATRPKTPEDLSSQIPKVKELLAAFEVPVFEHEGYEADDVMATIVKQLGASPRNSNLETILVSGDRDIFRLIDERTKVYFLRKGVKDTVLFDEQAVQEKYDGLLPDQLTDFKGLRGDPSDNIPGVVGVGEKTATSLVKTFGSLENVYKALAANTPEAEKLKASLVDKLTEQKEQAMMSKQLATLRDTVPLAFQLTSCAWGRYEEHAAQEALERYGFQSLIARLPELRNKEKV